MKYLKEKEYCWNPLVGDGNQPSEYVVFNRNGKLKNKGETKTGYIYIGRWDYNRRKKRIDGFEDALILNTPITEEEASIGETCFLGRNGKYSQYAVITINNKLYALEIYEPHGIAVCEKENLIVVYGHENIQVFKYDNNNNLELILNRETD